MTRAVTFSEQPDKCAIAVPIAPPFSQGERSSRPWRSIIERSERFRALYYDNYHRILGYALRRTLSGDDAHDVVGDTFLIAWRRLDDMPEGEAARLWLYGTARRVLANYHRSRRRQHRLADRLEQELHPPADGAGSTQHDRDWSGISTAFARLSQDDREVLLLTGWEGLDAGEIAAVLDCTRTTARVRLHRARKRFARELAIEGVQRSSANGHAQDRRETARPDAKEKL